MHKGTDNPDREIRLTRRERRYVSRSVARGIIEYHRGQEGKKLKTFHKQGFWIRQHWRTGLPIFALLAAAVAVLICQWTYSEDIGTSGLSTVLGFALILVLLWRHMCLPDVRARSAGLTSGKPLVALIEKYGYLNSGQPLNKIPQGEMEKWSEHLFDELPTLARVSREPDYLIVRNLFEKYPVGPSTNQLRRTIRVRQAKTLTPTDLEGLDWYSLKSAVIASGVAKALGGCVRDNLPNNTDWLRNYNTDIKGTKHRINAGKDLPLYYRTAAPHLSLPTDDVADQNAAPRFIIYSCVRNVAKKSIVLLRLEHILETIDAAIKELELETLADKAGVIDTLCKEVLKRIDRWDSKSFMPDDRVAGRVNPGPVFRAVRSEIDEDRLWLSWDINRFELPPSEQQGAQVHLRALAILEKAIDIASKEHREEILLKTGDALIIDNQRVMVRRFENDGTEFNGPFASGNWWLRGYHVFRN